MTDTDEDGKGKTENMDGRLERTRMARKGASNPTEESGAHCQGIGKVRNEVLPELLPNQGQASGCPEGSTHM